MLIPFYRVGSVLFPNLMSAIGLTKQVMFRILIDFLFLEILPERIMSMDQLERMQNKATLKRCELTIQHIMYGLTPLHPEIKNI